MNEEAELRKRLRRIRSVATLLQRFSMGEECIYATWPALQAERGIYWHLQL